MGWHELEGTQLASVCALADFPEVGAGCANVIDAYSGAAFDTKRQRLVLWGGGHNDYYGNEIYALDLYEHAFQRLTDPGLPLAPGKCGGESDCFNGCMISLAGGAQPNARHSYDGIEYVPTVDSLFIHSGALACTDGAAGPDSWTFDFAGEVWSRVEESTPWPQPQVSEIAVFDQNTGTVLLYDREYLYRFDPQSRSYTRFDGTYEYAVGTGWNKSGAFDPTRNLFVVVGDGLIAVADLDEGSATTLQVVETTGAEALLAADPPSPGIQYHPGRDRLIGWNGGDTVYSLDLDTMQWETHDYPGGPQASHNGTYKRFSYVASLDAFIVVNRYDENAYLLRLGEP